MTAALDREARGRFIVFEGLDGAGTTTQAQHLVQKLRDHSIAVEFTKEPTNGPLGAALRQVIDGRVTLDPVSLSLAFAADRTDHLFNEHNGVVSLLEQGRWVVCDRYVLSSLAYQPSELVDRGWLEEINRFAIEPDVTVFIDTEPERCVERITARSSTSELFHADEHLMFALRNYRGMISRGKVLGELVVVDGNGTVDAVSESVWSSVWSRLRPERDASGTPTASSRG